MEEMPIGRFNRILREFAEYPPLAEVARAFIKIEKPKELPEPVRQQHDREMRQMMKPESNAPEWYRRGYEKALAMQKSREANRNGG